MPPFNCISALGYTQEVNRLLTTGNNPDGELDQVSLFCSTFRERLGLWRCAFIGGDENSLKGDSFKGVSEREREEREHEVLRCVCVCVCVCVLDCRCSMGGREVVVVIVSRV